jgi:RimJ/RimL family protein N-acetyltransferase
VTAAPAPTERLAFRPWRSAEAAALLAMYSRPEVYRFLGAQPRPVADLDEARARVDGWAERTTGFCGIWAIEVRGSEQGTDPTEAAPIGTALLVPLPRRGQPCSTTPAGPASPRCERSSTPITRPAARSAGGWA